MNRDHTNNNNFTTPPTPRASWNTTTDHGNYNQINRQYSDHQPYDYYNHNYYGRSFQPPPPPSYPRFYHSQANLEEFRNPWASVPQPFHRPTPLAPQLQLPMRIILFNTGMPTAPPPPTTTSFMAPSNFQGNNASTMENEPTLTPNDQNRALKNLRKEMYNPVPRKLARRVSSFYRDRSELPKDPEDDGKRCAICLEDFVQSEMVTVTPCKHMFHEECIVPWMKSNGKCPVCRSFVCEREEASANNNNIEDDGQLSVAELVSVVSAMEDRIIWGHGRL